LNEIGQALKNAREKIGVSLAEVSEDIKIKELILENIEDGNIGCFKDIFELKEYIKSYAKYLLIIKIIN
jgi:cytoskeletal protein RodZ